MCTLVPEFCTFLTDICKFMVITYINQHFLTSHKYLPKSLAENKNII